MKVYKDINIPTDLNIASQSLCIGFFDGLHLAHQEIIANMNKDSSTIHAMLTFNKKLKEGPLLLSEYEKEKKLESLGIDKLFIIDFNDKIKNMSIDEFILFLEKNKLSNIYVGKDFTFANDKKGKSSDLLKIKNTNVHVIDLIKDKNNKISSTYIKELILDGKIKKANQLLGYNYSYSSNIINGFNRGKETGFKTLNMEILKNKILPKSGVYKTYSYLNNKKFLSMTNIGNNPTFNNDNISIETHIINEDIKLRVNYFRIEFVDFIRDEIKFKNTKELQKQLINDKNKILSEE